jgi:hypothetical protein
MIDIAIVAHDEDVDTEKVSHSTRDSKRGRFRAGRDASEMSGGAGNGRTVAWSAHDDEFRLAISH